MTENKDEVLKNWSKCSARLNILRDQLGSSYRFLNHHAKDSTDPFLQSAIRDIKQAVLDIECTLNETGYNITVSATENQPLI